MHKEVEKEMKTMTSYILFPVVFALRLLEKVNTKDVDEIRRYGNGLGHVLKCGKQGNQSHYQNLTRALKVLVPG